MTDLGALTTESVDHAYDDLDLRSVASLAAAMNAADKTVPKAVERALPQITTAIEAVVERVAGGGRLFYVGAGTPGRIGVLDASEIPPTFSEADRVIGVIAGGEHAIQHAIEGVEDDRAGGAADLRAHNLTADDAVIGVTSSGRTPYVLGAVEYAAEVGAVTVGLACNADSELSAVVDHAIEVLVGAEMISGSTRLKSGTAQKLVLNMFSTITMVSMGKTYGTLMVDVSATNVKLRERALRMVQQIAGVERADAVTAYDSSSERVPIAVIMLRRGVGREEAERMLEAANGRLRAVLEEAR